ncbi:MAG: polysaccharide biosynthesis protein [Pseudomonadota bacterium]
MSYVLIGGTGTLGKALMRQILAQEPEADVTSMSRDEQKIQEARREFPTVRFVVGDVRDPEAVYGVMRGAFSVFLLAAIKHVDIAEQNPLEAVKTNILGAVNVGEASAALGTPYVVFSNTDKAVLPITTYGYTKALAQNYLLSLNGGDTVFSAFTWGNIVASRGSVIPLFAKSLRERGAVQITDARMSRFWMRIEDAAAFMLRSHRVAPRDRAMIPPVKGATLMRVARAVASELGLETFDFERIGLRGTEKLYEVLESTHEGCLRSDTCEQYTDGELRALVRGVI